MRRAVAALAAASIATIAHVGVARADGDPASDVLATQSAFLPWDAGAAPAEQARLGAELAAAGRAGFPIRVAVIASPSDLGSVTALWHQPQLYARFLEQELSLVYKGPVLVVMPNGLGLAAHTQLPASESATVAEQKPAIARSALVAVAEAAIARLAAAAGHPLPASVLNSRVATTVPARPSDTTALIVVALGALLIVAAWGASLRARPVRTRSASSDKPSAMSRR